jgi:hypothetical protein
MSRGFLCSPLAVGGSGACLLTGLFIVDYYNITEGKGCYKGVVLVN